MPRPRRRRRRGDNGRRETRSAAPERLRGFRQGLLCGTRLSTSHDRICAVVKPDRGSSVVSAYRHDRRYFIQTQRSNVGLDQGRREIPAAHRRNTKSRLHLRISNTILVDLNLPSRDLSLSPAYRHSDDQSYDLPRRATLLHYISELVGFSHFPLEISVPTKEQVARSGNLVWCCYHSEGGHFAGMERPQLFAGDLEDFFEEAWKGVS